MFPILTNRATDDRCAHVLGGLLLSVLIVGGVFVDDLTLWVDDRGFPVVCGDDGQAGESHELAGLWLVSAGGFVAADALVVCGQVVSRLVGISGVRSASARRGVRPNRLIKAVV